MYEWSFATSVAVFLAITAFSLLLGSLRKAPMIGLISMVVAELLALINLAIAIVAVNSGSNAKTSTIEYFFYAGFALLVPLAALFWTLLQQNSKGFFVYAIASFTLFVMVVRMHQIWFGA